MKTPHRLTTEQLYMFDYRLYTPMSTMYNLFSMMKFDKKQNIADVFADAHEQVQKAIEHSCYPYVENNSIAVEDDVAYVLYQRDIHDAGDLDGMEIETVDIRQNKAASQSVLDIEILDSDLGPRLSLDYASSRYDRETMEHFKELFTRITAVLVHADGAEYITVKDLCDEVQKNHSFFRKFISVFTKKYNCFKTGVRHTESPVFFGMTFCKREGAAT